MSTAAANNNHSLQIYQSVTGFLGLKTDPIIRIQPTDYTEKRYAKLAVGTVVYATLTICGSIESFFRTLIAVFAKSVIFFVPKEYAKNLDEKIVNPLINHTIFTLYFTAQAAACLVIRFLSPEKGKKIMGEIHSVFNALIKSNLLTKIRYIHIDQFLKPVYSPIPIG